MLGSLILIREIPVLENSLETVFGITSKMMENLTTCLGSFSVSLQEMIAAYGVFMIAPAFMGYIAKYFGINYVFTPMIVLFCLCLLITIIFTINLILLIFLTLKNKL